MIILPKIYKHIRSQFKNLKIKINKIPKNIKQIKLQKITMMKITCSFLDIILHLKCTCITHE